MSDRNLRFVSYPYYTEFAVEGDSTFFRYIDMNDWSSFYAIGWLFNNSYSRERLQHKSSYLPLSILYYIYPFLFTYGLSIKGLVPVGSSSRMKPTRESDESSEMTVA